VSSPSEPSPIRIAFAGTPEFARGALEALHATGCEIVLVLTQPDRPAGRGMKLTPSPVKAFALEHGLALVQPRSLRLDGTAPGDARSAREALLGVRPDVMVVAAYGLILPPWALALPRLGCLNIHASLLPRWRGAAPIQRAILAGDEETGVGIMAMEPGLDTGPVLLERRIPIQDTDTTGLLTERLAALGAQAVVEALAHLPSLVPVPQDPEMATYAAKVAKAEARLDWRRDARSLDRQVRAFNPVPGAETRLDGESLKIWAVTPVEMTGSPGTVIGTLDGRPVVACGVGALALTVVQRAGSRRMPVEEFLSAKPMPKGITFELPTA